MAYGVTLRNTGSAASINSGNPVYLLVNSINGSYGRINSVEKGNNDALVKGDTMGRKLPSWQIHGKIDWRVTSSATVNGLTCTASTVTLLHAFNNLSQSTNSQIIMTAAHGGTTSAQYLRDFDNAAMSSGTNVAIDDLSWDLASDTEANHQWKYTMTVRQVSPE